MIPSQALLASDRQALQGNRVAMMRQVDEKLARGEATLEKKCAAVERDRAELDDEKARTRAAAPPPDDLVKLNVPVGGARFETSRTVLTKVEDSMLGRMFGRCDAMLQADPDDGSIFIDRDGEQFRVILDFLRDLDGAHTQKAIRALAEGTQESVMKELDYLSLEVAVFGVQPWTDGATFRPGPETGSRRSTCAAVFAGGRVVVFGGQSAGISLDTTEVLDTQTMAFTAGPNLLAVRRSCAAVLIDEDRVLLVSGYGGAPLNTTEIFHLSTLTVTPGPNMLAARSDCAAVALDARRIVVVGGHDGTSRLSTTEIFSLDTMTFAPGPTMAAPRNGCTIIALDEHRIMVAGGHSGSGSLTTTEVLDIRTMAFTPGPPMGLARFFCTAVRVDARHVLVVGGQDSASTILATTELLDLATMEFAPGPTMQAGRAGVASVRLVAAVGDGRILVLGGSNSSTEVLAVDAERGARATRHRH